MVDVLLGFLPLRCSTRGFLSWRAFSIGRLKASSWRAMLGAVLSSPHSPMATQSGDAIFPSSQLQSTSSRALGCAPQVHPTLTCPTTAGMCASHSARNTWLDTTASNPSTYDERCSCWKNGRMFSIVACMPDLCLNNSRWQWPSTTNARVGFDAGPWTSLAPDTCVRRFSGNSAIILIPVLQCSTADKSHGEEVAVVTVPPQYLTNCPHRTCLTTDCAGSRSAIQPRSWTTSPSFSQGTPKCSATTSNTAVMERNHVDNCWLPNLPSSSWTSQCFPCRWAWLLPLAWQCQQAFSGTQNHGKWMAWTCFFKHLRGSPHTVHWAISVSFPDSPSGFAGRVPSGSLGAASSWAVTETVRTSMGISGARFSCSPLLRVLVSATPLAGLRDRICDCATLLRGDLPLPITRLNSGDLLLSRPESPLALLGALALEPSFAPLLPLSFQLTVTVDCTDRSGDLLLSRRTGDLLLGERALLGDSPRVLSGRALSSPALLHCSWRPPRRERLRSSCPPTGLRPRAWGPLLLSGLLSVLRRPRSSWGLLLRELFHRRRERLRSSPLLAPGRPWYTTRRSPAKRE